MDNFFINIQSIKSHIDIISTQITNIISQYNNSQFQFDQLINLGIEMLNTGIYSFNLGKNKSMSYLDNYYIQLKNISEEINNMIKSHEVKLQQQIMQQQMMQNKMMNQFNINNNIEEKTNILNSNKKMNINFEFLDGKKINFKCDYGTKIKDMFIKFEKRTLKSKNDFFFILYGKPLNFNDERIIENTFPDGILIRAVEKDKNFI